MTLGSMAWGICGKFLPQVIFRADSLRSGGSGRLGVTCVVIRSSPSLLPHQTLVSDSGAGQRGSIAPGDWGRVVGAPQVWCTIRGTGTEVGVASSLWTGERYGGLSVPT